MSEANRLDPVALDEHITGHYGEDQYPEEEVPMADTDHQKALGSSARRPSGTFGATPMSG